MDLRKLLGILADRQFHSGSALALRLQVSRTAVWKRIRQLREWGLEIETSHGRGYRIAEPLELLEPRQLKAAISDQARPLLQSLSIHLSLPSTNLEVRRLPRPAADQGACVCLAERQTAGRGRMGRTWLSPFGCNLYLSLRWVFSGGSTALSGLTLAVGVVLVQALRRLQIEGLKLKWPNDLLWHDRKLAGILLEMSGDASGPCEVVIGIGLNVRMPSAVGQLLDRPWADLRQVSGKRWSRNQLAGLVLDELLLMLVDFQRRGFEAWHRQWQELDAYRQREVILSAGAQSIRGTALGVNPEGALRLVTSQGEQHFSGGEISLELP